MSASRYYLTKDMVDDPDAPETVESWGDITVGMAVRYVGPMPLEGEFTVVELISFVDFATAIMRDDTGVDYEVNPANLAPA